MVNRWYFVLRNLKVFFAICILFSSLVIPEENSEGEGVMKTDSRHHLSIMPDLDFRKSDFLKFRGKLNEETPKEKMAH